MYPLHGFAHANAVRQDEIKAFQLFTILGSRLGNTPGVRVNERDKQSVGVLKPHVNHSGDLGAVMDGVHRHPECLGTL
jgi:hypothetical protein